MKLSQIKWTWIQFWHLASQGSNTASSCRGQFLSHPHYRTEYIITGWQGASKGHQMVLDRSSNTIKCLFCPMSSKHGRWHIYWHVELVEQGRHVDPFWNVWCWHTLVDGGSFWMGHSIRLLAVFQNVIALSNLWMVLDCNHYRASNNNVIEYVSMCSQLLLWSPQRDGRREEIK